MADRRTQFRENVANVKRDANNHSKQLVQRLKQLTPAEFLRLPAKTFAFLTTAEYGDIVATIAPGTKVPAAPPVEGVVAEATTWRNWWHTRSTLTQMAIFTAVVTTIFVAVAIGTPGAWKSIMSRMEVVRPRSTATWPRCARLSSYTDGCVYYPNRDLQWAVVAEQLQMPRQELYDANRHLPPQFIPARAALVIWRHRGRLEE
ncbi:MAG: hypothetical protein ACREEK_22695 [Bradyrhizobium sp.]